jgi:hypothetical protein
LRTITPASISARLADFHPMLRLSFSRTMPPMNPTRTELRRIGEITEMSAASLAIAARSETEPEASSVGC